MVLVREATIEKIESMLETYLSITNPDEQKYVQDILDDLKAAKGGYGAHGSR